MKTSGLDELKQYLGAQRLRDLALMTCPGMNLGIGMPEESKWFALIPSLVFKSGKQRALVELFERIIGEVGEGHRDSIAEMFRKVYRDLPVTPPQPGKASVAATPKPDVQASVALLLYNTLRAENSPLEVTALPIEAVRQAAAALRNIDFDVSVADSVEDRSGRSIIEFRFRESGARAERTRERQIDWVIRRAHAAHDSCSPHGNSTLVLPEGRPSREILDAALERLSVVHDLDSKVQVVSERSGPEYHIELTEAGRLKEARIREHVSLLVANVVNVSQRDTNSRTFHIGDYHPDVWDRAFQELKAAHGLECTKGGRSGFSSYVDEYIVTWRKTAADQTGGPVQEAEFQTSRERATPLPANAVAETSLEAALSTLNEKNVRRFSTEWIHGPGLVSEMIEVVQRNRNEEGIKILDRLLTHADLFGGPASFEMRIVAQLRRNLASEASAGADVREYLLRAFPSR